jgi:leucyl-tRNA synthetase
LTAGRDYVKTTSSNITSAEAAQLKKKDKGKAIAFDPRAPKKLSIYAAAKYPAWQEKYIDLVREAFDATSISVNDKELNPKISKLGEMKKAMPFVQGLKRRLLNKESPQTVFDRQLAFDEVQTLREMVAGLKRTTGCANITIVAVNEGGRTGKIVKPEGGFGDEVDALPQVAEQAVPAVPTFFFENVKA